MYDAESVENRRYHRFGPFFQTVHMSQPRQRRESLDENMRTNISSTGAALPGQLTPAIQKMINYISDVHRRTTNMTATAIDDHVEIIRI